jgi:choline dehydrogenase-like flavoprotein
MQLFPLKMNILINRKYIFGMEVKIKDDNVGNVTSDGIINKTITKQDAIKLRKGQEIAKNILINAGIMPDSLITTKIRAAHLGGTAAFAKVVNNNQETKIKNLFISDASILPESPGLPPILTIIALSKRLANYLTKK